MYVCKKFKKKNGEKANLTNGRNKSRGITSSNSAMTACHALGPAIRRQPFLQDGTTAAKLHFFQKQYLKRVNVWYGIHVREWLSVSHSGKQTTRSDYSTFLPLKTVREVHCTWQACICETDVGQSRGML